MTMKSDVAMLTAVNRITGVISPVRLKNRAERQYLAQLIRPLAPNRNWKRSSMVPRHAECAGEASTPCVAPKRIRVQRELAIEVRADVRQRSAMIGPDKGRIQGLDDLILKKSDDPSRLSWRHTSTA
jgi:hypothetical protein